MKPILKWAGGKSSLLPQIKPHFPKKFDLYIEPFIGGGSVFLSLDVNNAIINDINPEIANLYNVVKNAPHAFMVSLDKLAALYSEDYYYAIRELTPTNPVMAAARTVFLNKTCFNGLYRQNKKGCFNVPFGKRKNCPELYQKENILEISHKLQKTQILCYDFEEVISMATKDTLIYCDSPYYPLSNTSNFINYYKTGFNEKDQIRLYNCCKVAYDKGAKVFISNSYCDFINDLYKEFKIVIVKARRNINSKGDARNSINENLIIME